MAGELETPQIDEREYLKMTDELKIQMMDLLTDVKNPLDGFKKEVYQKAFADYVQKHEEILRGLEDVYVCSPNGNEAMRSFAEEFAQSAGETLGRETKKRKQTQKLTDYNVILVVYLFPALIKQNPKSGRVLAEAILQCWKEAFPKTNLHLSTYEEIEEGFQQRFCYITTAVCTSLQKGDDCRELVMLRGYRDGYLSALPGGKELIRKYYDVAPTIVKHIDQREDAGKIYRNIYDTYLKICIVLIRKGRNEQCRKVYTDMVYDLEEKFFHKGAER